MLLFPLRSKSISPFNNGLGFGQNRSHSNSLHVHFSEWCIKSGSVPCSCHAFECLLVEQGFMWAEGLVYGLILANDERYRQEFGGK